MFRLKIRLFKNKEEEVDMERNVMNWICETYEMEKRNQGRLLACATGEKIMAFAEL